MKQCEAKTTAVQNKIHTQKEKKKELIIKGHAHFFNEIITTIRAHNDDEYYSKRRCEKLKEVKKYKCTTMN